MSLWPAAPRIVALTGAGISQESGLASLDEVATPEAFDHDAAPVQAFYNARRRQLLEPGIRPNAAHEALAALEALLPGEVLVVTRNIDDLHERAGSRAVIHMLGELLKARCLACGRVSEWYDDLGAGEACPACAIEGRLRPHVVWFGEMPLGLADIHAALAECKVFLAIGASGAVEPAAGFVAAAARAGAHTVELDLEPSSGAARFAEQIYGPAAVIVPQYVKKLLASAAG